MNMHRSLVAEKNSFSQLNKTPVALAQGDGIGPEISRAVLDILREAGAQLDVQPVRVGEAVYLQGINSGVAPEVWDQVRETGLLLKGPITTPQGGGYKSVNVSLRKSLGLFANVRPCRSFAPWVPTLHPQIDLVIVRENEEDTYGGIEHRQTDEVYQCLKLITRPGCEKIVRYAFEYARANGRKKVTCMTKDNIMKMTDGLFHRVFREIGEQYPELKQEHKIIDIGAAKLAARPQDFDVVVTPNLYGDILSDIAAELTGSVGLAGSANIGATASMFEAIHGSAPDIAGKNIANPSGMLNAAVMLLDHIGQGDVAQRVRQAWLQTIQDGIHTADIVSKQYTRQQVGTNEFARAVIERLGNAEVAITAGEAAGQIDMERVLCVGSSRQKASKKTLVGIDIFLHWDEAGRDPEALAEVFRKQLCEGLDLKMISNRGTLVWPQGVAETGRTDHWRCRVTGEADKVGFGEYLQLMHRLEQAGLNVVKTENLYQFDGEAAYSRSQGE